MKNYEAFNQIPKMYQASYRVDVELGDLLRVLDRWDSTYGLNLDPEYQRGYVWTLDQQIKYMEYIIRGGSSGKDLYFNCVDWMGDSMNPIELVDGKQRIKTVQDFYAGLVPVFGKTILDYPDRPDYRNTFLVHMGILPTQEEIVKWYIGMNTGGSAHTDEDLKPAFDYLTQLKNGRDT